MTEGSRYRVTRRRNRIIRTAIPATLIWVAAVMLATLFGLSLNYN